MIRGQVLAWHQSLASPSVAVSMLFYYQKAKCMGLEPFLMQKIIFALVKGYGQFRTQVRNATKMYRDAKLL